MEDFFEVRYISIEWIDQYTVSSIDEGTIPVEINALDTSSYSIDLQTYTRIENGLDGQVAFHILANKSDSSPYFINAEGNAIPLLKIINPQNNKEWWIEDGSWSKKYGCKLSELWNHVGETTIFIGAIKCIINISAISFTKEQLDLYVQDFKNDFWYLILKRDSLTHVNIEDGGINQVKLLNDDTIEKLSRFLGYIQNILKNPKKELREIQGLKDIKKIKPVPRTFMEIASSGFKKKLTSRDTEESYNVSENQYIHFILQQVYFLVFNMLLASKHINSFYINKAKAESERLNSFSHTIKISKEVFTNQLDDLKFRLKTINENLKNAISIQNENQLIDLRSRINSNLDDQISRAIKSQENLDLNNPNIQIFHIKLENSTGDYGNRRQFYGKIKIKDAETWDGEINKDLYSLEFDVRIFGFLDGNQEFYIKAKTEYKPLPIKNNKTLHKIFFYNILELIPLSQNTTNKLTFQTIIVSLDKQSEDFQDKIQFWGKARLVNQQNWYQFPKGDFLSLEFDKDLFDDCLQKRTEYKITAYYEKREVSSKNQTSHIHKRIFKYITEIEKVSISPLEEQINEYEKEKEKFDAMNWERQLTDDEKSNQDQEKEAIRQQIELLNEDLNVTSEHSKHLEPIIAILKQLLQQFSKLSVSQNSYFPNSMTFVQNPHYQGAYKYYELIKDIIGIDENLFIQMQIAEKIGVLDLPTLYERWCLLQIIKVLIDKYRFVPEKNWKVNLANQVLTNPNKIRNVSIEFTNENTKRKISFGYEKEFSPNGKRPDFTLDIESLQTGKTHKMIMDAKFKEDISIKSLIDELYLQKDYSQNNQNTVFILHPDMTNPIKKRLTDTDWGSKSYYGEVDMFHYEWDKNRKEYHRYGAILLSPIEGKGEYLDSLQRLIGLGIQYNLEDNQNIQLGNLQEQRDMLNPHPREEKFCIKCGSNKINIINFGPTRKQTGYYFQMKCQECNHGFVYFYCWNCKTRLIKNGTYWSYHALDILKPYDIKCPNCAVYWHDANQIEGNE